MRNICRIVLAITTAGMLAAAPPSALSQTVPPASAPCIDLDVIFARGSGGKLNSVESLRLQAQVAAGAKAAGITTNFYELGSRPDQQYAYPAVSVNDEKGALTALGAKVSGGQAFEYGRSVRIGVADAVHYIAQRVEKCKDARFFISGVSQGAQVIGEAYRELPDNLRELVILRRPQAVFAGGPARADGGGHHLSAVRAWRAVRVAAWGSRPVDVCRLAGCPHPLPARGLDTHNRIVVQR